MAETKKEETKVDAVVFLQDVVNRATKAGVFETATDASNAQACLSAVTKRLEELTKMCEVLTNENNELVKKNPANRRK